MSTSDFKIRFHRYPVGIKREISGPFFIRAASFSDAHEKAQIMVSAMEAADRKREYAIASITNGGLIGAWDFSDVGRWPAEEAADK